MDRNPPLADDTIDFGESKAIAFQIEGEFNFVEKFELIREEFEVPRAVLGELVISYQKRANLRFVEMFSANRGHSTATGLADVKSTPLEINEPGVEVQATIIARRDLQALDWCCR